jgi:hypothetical protein
MNRIASIIVGIVVIVQLCVTQSASITRIDFPDIPGYKTLKCDFHTHTVFSDGNVWPTFRVQEAWSEGLDAIAITDHLEYRTKKEYLKGDANTSIDLARATAKELGLILIPGAEITRKMPPGHLNALFVKDANALVKDDWKEVVKEAKNQDALIMWNHPGWESQQPDGIARWYDEHSFILGMGNLAGMEVVNVTNYYPEVLQWCLEKNVAVLGNSDTHDPIKTEYDEQKGEHRPLTLVFAKERSAEAIQEALVAGRTAVYSRNELIGKEELLRELVHASIEWSGTAFSAVGRERAHVLLTNASQLPFELTLVKADDAIQFPRELRLEPGKSTVFSIRARKDGLTVTQQMNVSYMVKNCIVAPGKNLVLTFPVEVKVTPKE